MTWIETDRYGRPLEYSNLDIVVDDLSEFSKNDLLAVSASMVITLFPHRHEWELQLSKFREAVSGKKLPAAADEALVMKHQQVEDEKRLIKEKTNGE